VTIPSAVLENLMHVWGGNCEIFLAISFLNHYVRNAACSLASLTWSKVVCIPRVLQKGKIRSLQLTTDVKLSPDKGLQ
jgi:hypothetical protein